MLAETHRRTTGLSVPLLAISTLVLALLLGCGGGGTGPDEPTTPNPRFRVIAGAGITDTIDARPVQALTVEIRDSTGKLAVGRTVRFESLSSADSTRRYEQSILVAPLAAPGFGVLSTDVTDNAGRAKSLIGFASYAGTARLRVVVPELGMVDTVSYTVKPGAPFKILVGVRDTTVQPGASYSLRASFADRYGNPTTGETPTYTASAGITSVSPTGQVTAGSAIARGRITISWRTLTDSAHVSILPLLPIVATGRSAISGRAVSLAKIDGSGIAELARSGDFSLAPKSVSATASVVYYQADPEFNASVWIVAPGQPARVLVSLANGFVTAAWPSWSPDGAWVYFTGARTNPFVRSAWRIRTDGTQLDSLGVYNRTARFETVFVSPDGSTAAIAGDGGVKLVNVATKTSRVIPGNCHVPRYSPDGRQFACLVNDELAVMNVDGSAARTIVTNLPPYATRFEEYAGIDWSPDGNWLVAQSTYAGPQLVRVSDGVTIPLTNLGPAFSQVSFVR
ncbi:MAG: hypothetical protein ABIP93_12290 [Gemmatimonadaceae bacterium]